MFHKHLNTEGVNKIVQKGTDPQIDSYSGFFDNGHLKQTDLDAFLKSKKVEALYIMGLATDYCVKYTVLDALYLGYKTILIKDATWGVNLNNSDVETAITEMEKAGAIVINSTDL